MILLGGVRGRAPPLWKGGGGGKDEMPDEAAAALVLRWLQGCVPARRYTPYGVVDIYAGQRSDLQVPVLPVLLYDCET